MKSGFVAVIGALGLGLAGVSALGCEREGDVTPSGVGAPSPSGSGAPDSKKPGGPPLGPPPSGAAPRAGMAYIPPGALVVGTPRDKKPRRPDRELPGEQIMLEGFYIDQLAYPNEEGAIPVTNVTRDEAAALCKERDKRLCSELEWERACKGPDNRTFEYGETYRASTCDTGRPAQLRPGGYHVGCLSDFGVRDLHGGPFEWTSSEFARGLEGSWAAVRGGNGPDGEVMGRCANAEPENPSTKSGAIGFRCCAGNENDERVELKMSVTPGLVARARFEEAVEEGLLAALPKDVRADLEKAGKIRRERVWLWHPVGNEEFHLLALCGRGRPPPHGPRCGLFVARVVPGKIEALAFASSGQLVANLHRPGGVKQLWLVGGDVRGSFKQLISYRSGDVMLGDTMRGGAPRDREK